MQPVAPVPVVTAPMLFVLPVAIVGPVPHVLAVGAPLPSSVTALSDDAIVVAPVDSTICTLFVLTESVVPSSVSVELPIAFAPEYFGIVLVVPLIDVALHVPVPVAPSAVMNCPAEHDAPARLRLTVLVAFDSPVPTFARTRTLFSESVIPDAVFNPVSESVIRATPFVAKSQVCAVLSYVMRPSVAPNRR